MTRADVPRPRSGGGVGWPWLHPLVRREVNGVRDQVLVRVSLVTLEPRRAHDHLARVVKEESLVGGQTRLLALATVGEQPVVGDVVEGAPLGELEQAGAL